MKWKMVFGMIVAVGSLTATAVRAQENAAGSGAPATKGQVATSDRTAHGPDFDEPATVDASGVPVAKPNPMSDFLKRARQLDGTAVEMPLVDDFRTDGTGTDGETK